MFQCTARVAPEKAVFRPALPPHPLPGLSGTDMTKMTYREQLLHPNWQRRRLEMLARAVWMCQRCGDTDKTLHVHHKGYVKGRMAWEYEDQELLVVCDECHAEEHRLFGEISDVLRRSWRRQEEVLDLLTGFCLLPQWPSTGGDGPVSEGLTGGGQLADAIGMLSSDDVASLCDRIRELIDREVASSDWLAAKEASKNA